MTIQIDSEKFLEMLTLHGATPNDETQRLLNNLNEMLARMPNFTPDDLKAVMTLIAKGFPQ